jgi:NAD(P)H-dependent FMN reductase
MPNILSICGTSRPDNYTAFALRLVNDELRRRGIEPAEIDARALDLPFPGYPATADSRRLLVAVEAANALVLATPEYHGSFCAMTKLIIENLGFPSVLAGKPVMLIGAAAGRIGAIKSLEQLKGVCSHIGAIVVPGAVSIAGVRAAFAEDGRCLDQGAEDALRGAAGTLLGFIRDFVCPKYALEEMARGESVSWSATL